MVITMCSLILHYHIETFTFFIPFFLRKKKDHRIEEINIFLIFSPVRNWWIWHIIWMIKNILANKLVFSRAGDSTSSDCKRANGIFEKMRNVLQLIEVVIIKLYILKIPMNYTFKMGVFYVNYILIKLFLKEKIILPSKVVNFTLKLGNFSVLIKFRQKAIPKTSCKIQAHLKPK